MKAVVFDIGGVLVDWQPHLVWADELGSEEAAHAFIDRTGFSERNTRADNGERFADMAQELPDAEDQRLFASYVENYGRSVQNLIHGTWEILEQLKAQDRPVHAITNWSAETWPAGVETHPRLGTAFDTLVVSGQECLMKPDRRIFEILFARAQIAPDDCIFIDDSLPNIRTARALGMDGIHFTSPQELEGALTARGVF